MGADRRRRLGGATARVLRVCGAAGALGLLLVLVLAAPAAAHAELERTVPADGARLDEAPEEVTLVFSEPVSADLGGLQVVDADGGRADEGAVRVDGPEVSVALGAGLAEGSYVVTYRVVSADGHPIRGALLFAVGADAPDESLLAGASDEAGERWWRIAGHASRWLAYAGTFVAAGGAVFTAVVLTRQPARRRLGTVITLAAVAGAVGILAALPVQAVLATGRGAGALFEDGVLGGVLAEGVGWATAAGILGLVLVVALRRWNRWVGVAGAALAAGSFAFNGHNRASDVPALATVADVVHLWAAATWFGGMALLVVALRDARLRGPDPVALDAGAASNTALAPAPPADDLQRTLDSRRDRQMVARFSTVAATALVLTAAAGAVLGWVEVRSVGALTSTDYGRLLIAKVGVVALVVVLAAYNNRVLVPAVADERRGRAIPRLRTVVLAELVLLTVAIGITAVLVITTPARGAETAGIVEEVVELGDHGSAQIVVDPGRAGANTVHLYTLDAQGRPAAIGDELVVEASLPDAGIGPLERVPVRVTRSHLRLDGDLFAVAGTWEVTLRLRVDRFTEVTGVTLIPIAP